VVDVSTNETLAQGVTARLSAGASTADITPRTTDILTGARRVRIEFLPDSIAGAEVFQIPDSPSNHFTVLQIPA
jgi:hypothetical protein